MLGGVVTCARCLVSYISKKQRSTSLRGSGMSGDTKRFYVYWLQAESRVYIGATVDPAKRLRQHNGEIAGGASRTRNRGPWRFQCVISGFRTWKEALQYEWAFKYYSKNCRCIPSRQNALNKLNTRERWTQNSPLASEINLTIEHEPQHYGLPPSVYEKRERTTTSPSTSLMGTKRPFKKRLHGVSY